MEPLGFFTPKPPLGSRLPDISKVSAETLDIPMHRRFKKPHLQLIHAIELEHRLRCDYDGRTELFRTNSGREVFPGSILRIEQVTSRSNPRKLVYTGILKEVYKNSISSSIVLETVELGTTIKIRFPIYSPMITKIEVLKREIK